MSGGSSVEHPAQDHESDDAGQKAEPERTLRSCGNGASASGHLLACRAYGKRGVTVHPLPPECQPVVNRADARIVASWLSTGKTHGYARSKRDAAAARPLEGSAGHHQRQRSRFGLGNHSRSREQMALAEEPRGRAGGGENGPGAGIKRAGSARSDRGRQGHEAGSASDLAALRERRVHGARSGVHHRRAANDTNGHGLANGDFLGKSRTYVPIMRSHLVLRLGLCSASIRPSRWSSDHVLAAPRSIRPPSHPSGAARDHTIIDAKRRPRPMA